MPEQPQWGERTLDMPPQDPWAEPPTAAVHQQQPTRQQPVQQHEPTRQQSVHQQSVHQQPERAEQPGQPFSRGRAQVNAHPRTQQFAAEHEPTGTGWPGEHAPQQRRSVGWHARELRRGGEWSVAALLFAFVCWGIWAISEAEDLTAPIIVFVLSVLVAGGLFALARVLGHYVLERQLHRVRRTAKGSHVVAAVFLAGVGIAHLQQTGWVMEAYRWVAGLFTA